jgi:urease gamma subunit
MIYIRVLAQGEPDAQPLARTFQYSDGTDELILRHSVEMVEEKLGKKMRINVNEALLLYCNYIAGRMRAKEPAAAIEAGAGNLLSAEQVLIGVPETLRTVVLDAIVDGRRERIAMREPIQSRGYVMAK